MSEPGTPGAGGSDFVLTRTLAAPRALVWRAWTERDDLMQWFGPAGVTMLPASTLDLREGGRLHYGMRMPNGQEMWGLWVFREIVAPERLVLISSFSDAGGGITRHPMSATWPLHTLSTTTFAERDGQTEMTLRWNAWNATPEERATFDGAHAGMEMGWAGTMRQLTDHLAKVQQR